MPAEIDDLLLRLGRDADAIPLAGAAQARARGRQRTHRQAALSAALAVCLVAVGVGVVVSRPRHNAGPTFAPTPSSRALTEVGSPVNTGGPATSVAQAAGSGKLFSAWVTPGGELYLNAADLHTGAVLWTVAERAGTVIDVRALASAVMVRVNGAVSFYDPASGDRFQRFRVSDGDDLVPYGDVMVRRTAAKGDVVANDIRTGRPTWSDTAHPTANLIGDGERLIQVTKAGEIVVRDAVKGTPLRTITPAMAPNAYGESQFVITDGRLFFDTIPCCDTAAYQIVDTDLSTGDSSVLLSEGPEPFVGMTACGEQRLCILDDRPQVTAIDLVSRAQLWQSPGPQSAGIISAIGDSTLVTGGGPAVVLDGGGQPAFRAPDANVDRLDEDTVLVTPRLTAGTVMTVDIPDRRITRLGEVPAQIGNCVHTTDRLACPTKDSLRLWSLTG
ncbi:PQQ-binding-like beta-propeller repeat protein [Actinoplanes sp. CA-054009]